MNIDATLYELIEEISFKTGKKYSVDKEISFNRGARVIRLFEKSDNDIKYALKLACDSLEPSNDVYCAKQLLDNEIKVLRALGNNFTGINIVGDGETNDSSWLLSEWSQHKNSFKFFKEQKKKYEGTIPESVIVKCLISIVKKIKTLHSLDYLHGDLQPKHIFISDSFECSLIDFGLSHASNSNFKYLGGMVHFNSPEICQEILSQGQAKLTVQSEIYSLGSVIYFLCTNSYSTNYGDNKNLSEYPYEYLLSKISNEGFNQLNSPIESTYSSELVEIMNKLLSKETKYRYSDLNSCLDDLSKIALEY